MTISSEKRNHQRYDHVTKKVMYQTNPETQFNNAMLINYSEGGMYLRTEKYLEVGQTLTIKMEESKEKTTGPEKYDSYSGQVKWTNNARTNSDAQVFQCGIEYDAPVTYF